MSERGETRIGILISGRGSNMRAIVSAWKAGRIPGGTIACVISNRPDAAGLALADEQDVPAVVVARNRGESREDHDGRILEVLAEHQVGLVCLAGYMRLLSPRFIEAYRGRILNIHPSLLPAFPGLDAQRQAFEHGAKVTGATVHFVDEDLDAGPIVSQLPVTIWDDDTVQTLTARILEKEHRIYPDAVSLYTQGRLRIEGRRVVVLPRER